ncbi:hypothetical protein L210DRAFT_2647080 [Boletus edulis BED1]|uniref:Uncharacterized protein n=1 Tax=Boletus edulis BED1 TaxID=1328754 RepID=A0AAD4GJP8_BOLED|nr:hypothetical protein L210DRAFT_2647080 [Boletus edulis BED1]
MTFDLLSRFRRPLPTRDARGPQHVQRPPPMVARVHGKRPAHVPQVRPQARRVHQQPTPAMAPRALVPARKGPVARPPPPSRRGPTMRPPARPLPPQRASSKLMNCLHFNFHPSQKRDLALPPLRSSKHMSGQHAPPFPPPRGAIRAPPRHVHWAPAQAPLPPQPYPYPSHASSRTSSSRTPSHARTQHYPSPPAIPRYQAPSQTSRGMVLVPHRRR